MLSDKSEIDCTYIKVFYLSGQISSHPHTLLPVAAELPCKTLAWPTGSNFQLSVLFKDTSQRPALPPEPQSPTAWLAKGYAPIQSNYWRVASLCMLTHERMTETSTYIAVNQEHAAAQVTFHQVTSDFRFCSFWKVLRNYGSILSLDNGKW